MSKLAMKKGSSAFIKSYWKNRFFLKKYPDYAIDLKFKKNLIQNQSAKELYIAKYYITIQNDTCKKKIENNYK